MSMSAGIYAAMIGAISARPASAPPKTTWQYWGIEFGVDASQVALRVRGLQWNFTPGTHTQNLGSSSNIRSDVYPTSNDLTDLYTNSSIYAQWTDTVLTPNSRKVKIWGNFGSQVTVRSIGIYAQSFSTYWPDNIRHIWSDDAVTWYGGAVVNTPTWITANYVWFDNGF